MDRTDRTPGRRLRWPATGLFVVTTAMYVSGLSFMLASQEPVGLNELLLPVGYSFAVVGYLIALRRWRNAIAWVCFGIGLVWGLESLLVGAAIYGAENPGSVPWPEALGAIGAPLWIPGVFLIATYVLLLFPDGRLPSRRWTWLAWLAGTSIGLAYVATVLSEPETYSYGRPATENPFAGVLGPWLDEGGFVAAALEVVAFFGSFVAVGGSIAALVTRYRRSRGIERHQLKWLAMAGSAAVSIFVVSIFLVDFYGEEVGLIAALSFILIPVSIGIAVLRYRLYEIDRLVSRSISYALVVATLGVVFAAIAIGIPQALAVPADSPLLVAGATLAVAATFNPLRRHLLGRVDRRFNRARYDAQQEVGQLSDRLRAEVELGDVTGEVLEVVAKTMEPAAASVWIRDGHGGVGGERSATLGSWPR